MEQPEQGLVASEPVQIQPAADRRQWWQNTYVHIAIILVVGSLVYSRIFSAPFVFDDYEFIVMNPAICDFRFVKDMTILKNLPLNEDLYKNIVLRPVSYLTFAVNHQLNGFDVVGYHLFNVIVHLLNALLVYLVTSLTLARTFTADKSGEPGMSATRLIPLFTSLLFVCHPVQTQAVTYITQRFTSLAALFFLFSLALYIKSGLSRNMVRRFLYYAGSLIAACIAMKTKENAFTLPLIILVYEYTFFANNLKRRIAILAPFMLTMLIIPVTVMKLGTEFPHAAASSVGQSMNLVNYIGVSQWDYLFTQFRVIVIYIRLLLIPINQHLGYDIPLYTSLFQTPVALSLSLIVTLLGTGIYLLYSTKTAEEPNRTKIRLIAFGIIWFFVTLSVESSIIPLDEKLVEQRVYLPSVGFILACVTTMALMFEKRRRAGVTMFAAIAGSVVVALSTVAYSRNYLWRDPIALWRDTAQKSPRKARTHFNLGAHYFEKGRLPEALDAFTTGLRLEPEKVEASVTIANIYIALNRTDEAEAEFLRAIKMHPYNGQLYNNLGRLYIMQNKHSKALPLLQQATQINPFNPEVHTKLAELYEAMGQPKQAVSEYIIVLKLVPGDPVTINRINKLNEK